MTNFDCGIPRTSALERAATNRRRRGYERGELLSAGVPDRDRSGHLAEGGGRKITYSLSASMTAFQRRYTCEVVLLSKTGFLQRFDVQ